MKDKIKDELSWALFDFIALPLLIIIFLLVPLWRFLDWKQKKQVRKVGYEG